MADFNITVDTSPMARSLDVVNSNVSGVTASVVAMESAVVIAQEQAAQNICHNVDTGFYILMKSQFDQKIAAVSSKMLSQMQLMESFKNDIDKIMLIMQDDYERIKQRYMKHFNSLDKALETRIHELDKRAYEISRNYKMSQFKTGSEVIKAICYNDDTQLLNVKQMSAIVKSKSSKSIGVMANDVIDQLKYTDSVKSILKDVTSDTAESEFVPVIFTETDSMMSADSSIKNVITTQEAEFVNNPRFLNQLKEASDTFEWKEISDAEFEPIKNSFQSRVNSEISDERVAKEMIRLFGESKWAGAGGN
jgi:hypothetical protein